MVVDVVGTLDECRFTLDGFHVSKEMRGSFTRRRLGIGKWKKQRKRLKRGRQRLEDVG
jgi:phosphoribosylaminoimidazole-succinocarboxamide synthase